MTWPDRPITHGQIAVSDAVLKAMFTVFVLSLLIGIVAAGAAPKSDDKKKPFGGEKKESKDWTCSASLVFEADRLARVSFAHREVRSPYAWQSEKDPKKKEQLRREPVPTCTFSLPRCAR